MFFTENRFFYHLVHPNQFPLPPLLLAPCHVPPTPFHFPSISHQKKKQTLKRQLNTTKQDTIEQDKNPDIEAGQGNLIRGKESKEQAKESETHSLPQLGGLQKHQAVKPQYIFRGPGADLYRPGVCCFSL